MLSKPLLVILEEDKGLLIGLEMGLKGEEDNDEGVVGFEFEESPKLVLALRMRLWRFVSGPKAKRINSFSPWSCKRRYPMIFEAFSGSNVWILEKTTLVASYESMVSSKKAI